MNAAVDLRPNISVQGQRTATNTKDEDDDEILRKLEGNSP